MIHKLKIRVQLENYNRGLTIAGGKVTRLLCFGKFWVSDDRVYSLRSLMVGGFDAATASI
jgi:hypothetical protein